MSANLDKEGCPLVVANELWQFLINIVYRNSGPPNGVRPFNVRPNHR